MTASEIVKKNRAVIKASRITINGKQMWKIEKFCGFKKRSQLPKEYTKQEPYMVKHDDSSIYIYNENHIIRVAVGYTYTNDQMEKIVTDMKACGERLTEINKKTREERKWRGEKLFVI